MTHIAVAIIYYTTRGWGMYHLQAAKFDKFQQAIESGYCTDEPRGSMTRHAALDSVGFRCTTDLVYRSLHRCLCRRSWLFRKVRRFVIPGLGKD